MSLRYGGTTLSDYRTVEAARAATSIVYGQAGLPCPRCGTELRSRTLDGRTASGARPASPAERRPRHVGRGGLGGPDLVAGQHHQLVDVHVRRTGGHPADALGDVVGRQRLDARVDRRPRVGIAAEAHEAELGLDQARVDLHPHGSSSSSAAARPSPPAPRTWPRCSRRHRDRGRTRRSSRWSRPGRRRWPRGRAGGPGSCAARRGRSCRTSSATAPRRRRRSGSARRRRRLVLVAGAPTEATKASTGAPSVTSSGWARP